MKSFVEQVTRQVEGMISSKDLSKELDKQEGALGKKFVLQH
jgi:hypothetical protein